MITPCKGSKAEILVPTADSSVPKYAAEKFLPWNIYQFSGTAQNKVCESRSYMLLQSGIKYNNITDEICSL